MNRFLTNVGKRFAILSMSLLLACSPFATLVTTAQAQTTPPATTGASVGVSGNDIGCSISSAITNAGGTFALCLTNVVYIFTVGLGSGFAYVSAYFFDLATQLSLNGTAYALSFISTGWTTARDLANMAFLFILLYIAFQILLSAETAGTMQLLAGVIAVALLVNFSFVFTRLVVDAGNIVSIEFYNSIQAPSLQTSAAASGVQAAAASAVQSVTGSSGTKDLTANIMGMLQLQNLFSTNSFNAFFKGTSVAGQPATPPAGFMVTAIALTFLYVAAGILFWLLSVMFITTGVKFLIRIVVLWFLIIFSPLAFVAWAVPPFKSYFTRWRSLLFTHAFYPVAFMFIFLMLTNFANQMSCNVNGVVTANCTNLIDNVFNGLTATANSSSAVASIGYALANVGIRLGFVIAILYMGMQAAQSVSVMGASTAAKAGNWFGGTYAGWMKGGANFARNTVTRTAGGIYAGGVGSAAYDTAQQLKGTKFGNTRLGAVLRRGILEPVANSKVGGARSYTEVVKARDTFKKEASTNIRDIDNKARVEAIGVAIQKNVAAGDPAGKDIRPEDRNKIQTLNDRELGALSESQMKAILPLLKENQIKTLEKLEKLTDESKEKIRTTWEEKGEEAPLQKAIKRINDLQAANSGVAAIVREYKASGNHIDTTASQKIKALLEIEHDKRKEEHNENAREYRAKRQAAKQASDEHKAAAQEYEQNQNAANLQTMQDKLDAMNTAKEEVKLAEVMLASSLAKNQQSQDILNKYKEFDDSRKDIAPNANINNNGPKGTFKPNLID